MPFCVACGAKLDTPSNFCKGCGAQLSATVDKPKRKTSLGVKILTGFLGLVIVAVILGALDNSEHSTSSGSASSVSVAPSDPADLLVSQCGQPSLDDSTAYDNPRPPIPSRTIEFSNHKLRFMFIPTGQLGDTPPYRWKLVGITDMTAIDPSHARVVSVDEASQRMPCWSAK